jgi:hypothetical protein
MRRDQAPSIAGARAQCGYPMTKIDTFSLTAVPVEQCANGKPFGVATAFAWKRGAQHYLITNWHVVTGRHAQSGKLETIVQPDMIRPHFDTQLMDFGTAMTERVRNRVANAPVV